MAIDFKCARCGHCCKKKKINITYSDIMRWESEGHFDILSEVNLVQFKKDIDFTGFYFGKTALREGCPFLLFDGIKTNCRIYETRPKCCRNQPECIEPSDEKLNNWKSCQGIKNRTRFDDSHFKEIRQDEYEDLRQAYIHRKQVFEIIRQARIIDPSTTLNVNAYINQSRTGWTYTGTSPYLDTQDQPTNQISTDTKSVSTNDFGFPNLEAATTSVSSVILNIYCLASSSVKSSSVYVWDGASYSSAYTLSMPTAFAYVQIDVSAWLNTVAKVNAAQIYITSAATTQTYTVDHAYLDVTYATPVTINEYGRFFDPTISATKTAGGVPNTQTVQEYIKLFDVFGPSLASFQRQIQDYGNLGDVFTYRASIQQQIIEYAKLWDIVSATAGLPPATQTIQEYIKVFDSLTRSLVKTQVINEWINIFESITTVSRYVRVSYEWIKSFDVISERLTSTRQIQEWIRLFDASTQTSSLIRIQTINEWLRIFESATIAARYVRISIEWVKLFETQTRLAFFNRQIVEYTTIFDTVTATTEELSNLILQLIKCVELP